MKLVRLSELRKDLARFANEVHYTKETVILVKHGEPWMQLVPITPDDPAYQQAMQALKK